MYRLLIAEDDAGIAEALKIRDRLGAWMHGVWKISAM